MKKWLIALAIIVFIGTALVFYFSYTNLMEKKYVEELKAQLNSQLESESYIQAFRFFTEQEEEYQHILRTEIDNFTNKICKDALNDMSSVELNAYKNAGGNFQHVNETIAIIDEYNNMLKASAQSYSDAAQLFSSRQFDDARIMFEAVIEDDENYADAQYYLAEIDKRENAWSSDNSIQQGYLNACAYDGQYAYVPFTLYGVYGIYKITAEGDAVDFFPLSREESQLFIGGINVVGDYLYFIAGEKTGSGYSMENPYCIYEMKTDGTGLTLLLEGNFTDMHIADGKVYTISREDGLVVYDRNFIEQEVISAENVVEFSFSEDEIYYTVQGDLTHDSDNTAYFYDGETSAELDTKEYLHCYNFGDEYVKQWQVTPSKEILEYGTDESQVEFTKRDVINVYGLIDNRILYTYSGSVGQGLYAAYDIESEETVNLPTNEGLTEFEVLSILYEGNKLVVEKDNTLYLCDAMGDNETQVAGLAIYKDEAEQNASVIKHITDDDLYTQSGEQAIIAVIKDKQFWVYKDENLHIALEKRYIDEYDTNVYVTHIYTNDYALLKTGNGDSSPSSSRTFKASFISEKYHAVYAQSTDAFYNGSNLDKGIIIRESKLLRNTIEEDTAVIFNDGTMEVYRPGDITGEELMDMGATTAFAFGPILVENYNVVPECAFKKLVDRNPRSAIGYVDKGHYVMVACDGRDYAVSRGLSMIQLAQVFRDEGCELAYNLDGGLTSTVLFMGNYITHRPEKVPSSEQHVHRSVAEIFYVGTNELSTLNLGDYTYDYGGYCEEYK